MNWLEKPVIIVGHGAKGYDLSPLYGLGVPILTSWLGADLIDNWHPLWFGRPGIYGMRMANKVLYEADQILSIGCRLSPWVIGHGGLRPEQKLVMVDVDGNEVAKFPQADWVRMDVQPFVHTLTPYRGDWMKTCEQWRYPLVESAHADTPGYINSYRFVERLQPYLRPDEALVMDNGCTMCPVYQSLKLKPGQTLIASGSLGEMGYGLPGSVGVSFSRGKGEVLTMIGDGSMMMNIQELSVIYHHKLPIKMIIFENDGYGMIKSTFTNMNKPRRGVDKASGLSFPDFKKVLSAWGFMTGTVRTLEDFDKVIPQLFASKEPAAVVYHLDPEQDYLPRLHPIIKDGQITPARLDQLSPILTRKLVEADLA